MKEGRKEGRKLVNLAFFKMNTKGEQGEAKLTGKSYYSLTRLETYLRLYLKLVSSRSTCSCQIKRPLEFRWLPYPTPAQSLVLAGFLRLQVFSILRVFVHGSAETDFLPDCFPSGCCIITNKLRWQ